ncbi:MAG: DUF4089 domain-containing protein [Geminicoccaceae bacterium]
MKESAFDPDAVIDAMAPFLDLPVEPAWRDEVRQHLEIARRMAKLVQDAPLDDEAEPAPVFTP